MNRMAERFLASPGCRKDVESVMRGWRMAGILECGTKIGLGSRVLAQIPSDGSALHHAHRRSVAQELETLRMSLLWLSGSCDSGGFYWHGRILSISDLPPRVRQERA